MTVAERLAKSLSALKQEFVQEHSRNVRIQEVIPISSSDMFPIDPGHLESLHSFASANPIYYNLHEKNICNTPCMIYEGDANRFWLSSIGHKASRAPFSPTWILSAYIAAMLSKELGAVELVDVGSGDGRIAYCGKILGLTSHSIELDDALADLQISISESLSVNFNPICSDAAKFAYSGLSLSRPAFFIGGLAQMGGDILAESIIKRTCFMLGLDELWMVFAGTYSPKYQADRHSMAGWGDTIQQNGLKLLKTILLPTAWTFDEPADTPYVFARCSNRNPN